MLAPRAASALTTSAPSAGVVVDGSCADVVQRDTDVVIDRHRREGGGGGDVGGGLEGGGVPPGA